ncbi:MAG: DNA-binding response regulator [Bacteroidetes bacterium]|nr:MAG: DNA-binding response regulator [Bacteroidota bacterium]
MQVLIIEDERRAADRLATLIRELMPEAQIADMPDSVDSAVAWLSNHKEPDLLLMDIQLADGSSFEIFREVELTAPVIFTTAYDQYAVKAFKVNSLDYLLKPIRREELAAALDKFRRLRADPEPQLPDYRQLVELLQGNKPQYLRRFVIRYGGKIRALEASEAAYFYIESRVTLMRTRDGKTYPIDYNLDQLEELLDPAQFFRLNRQVFIHIDAISGMLSFPKSRIQVDLAPPAKLDTMVSSERSARFKQWLTGGL